MFGANYFAQPYLGQSYPLNDILISAAVSGDSTVSAGLALKVLAAADISGDSSISVDLIRIARLLSSISGDSTVAVDLEILIRDPRSRPYALYIPVTPFSTINELTPHSSNMEVRAHGGVIKDGTMGTGSTIDHKPLGS
jgi:hypothetical protein